MHYKCTANYNVLTAEWYNFVICYSVSALHKASFKYRALARWREKDNVFWGVGRLHPGYFKGKILI